MPTLHFTVDSALLRELGERLVAKPYVALAELVKNSYDADATKVKIELDPNANRIVVSDDGCGMDLTEFKNFWMRVGSIHKQRQRVSKKFGRQMVGSKGIGRFAVQFLAEELEIRTVSESDLKKKLVGHITWANAVQAGDLTKASVEYRTEEALAGSTFEHGTTIVLKKLKHRWDENSIKKLAGEIWWLEPPFRGSAARGPGSFEIEFVSPVKGLVETFGRGARAIMEAWHARLVGKNENGNVTLSLQFEGEEQPIVRRYSIPGCEPEGCKLREGNFEIRIYSLTRRQRFGIKVGEARKYMRQYGGVHVYDGGFHLPFYGAPENDWLNVEFDHSHRLSMSKLLPSELQVKEGMTLLPTLSRVLGMVNVDTSQEPELRISITRDRLQENEAYAQLVGIVRWALDFYAMEEAKRVFREKTKVAPPKFERLEEVLVRHQREIPKNVYKKLCVDTRKAVDEVKTGAELMVDRFRLLAPLAAAGISSLACQHEIRRQFGDGEEIAERMKKIVAQDPKIRKELDELREDLSRWLERAAAIYSLFSFIAHPEDMKERKRRRAKVVVDQIREQVGILARGIPIRTARVDGGLLLPKATFAQWSAIFQNVLINAFNAMEKSERKIVDMSSRASSKVREILVQDTGCGVNLKKAGTLFEPFVREIEIPPERRAAGYGGMGLGLAIVRMIASNIGCKVSFVSPEKGFSTAFSIKWREEK